MHNYTILVSIYLTIAAILTSCNLTAQENNETENIEMTQVQIEAFDALNLLQVNTQGHLFSTFVDAQNTHSTPDSSFVLSQAELKSAILRIIDRYGTNLSTEKFNQLAEASVLAQKEYRVEFYSLFEGAEKLGPNFKGLPTTGKWIIRSILNQRDLILEW